MPSSPLDSIRSKRHAAERRNTPQALMLDLRFASGDRLALPYAYMVSVQLHGSSAEDLSLELMFTTHRVQVFGRNLQELYGPILTHSLDAIDESHTPIDGGGEEDVFVSRLESSRLD